MKVCTVCEKKFRGSKALCPKCRARLKDAISYVDKVIKRLDKTGKIIP